MAKAVSDTVANGILDHMLGGPNWVRSSSVYLAAMTVAPVNGVGGTECTAPGYQRLEVANTEENFPRASGRTKTNGTRLEWDIAIENWGTIQGICIYDADLSTGGTRLMTATGVNKPVSAGDNLNIHAGKLTFTLN